VALPRLEPVVRVGVTVTFLRLDAPPADPAPKFPAGVTVRVRPDCTVAEYRALYDGVGADYCWWLRRVMPDRQLEAMLRAPAVLIHTLHIADRVSGFHELDRSPWPTMNINYFGLLPHAVGQGLGYGFLRHAVDTAFGFGAKAVTVNTCTADHPRALPTYLRAGFKPVRAVDEVWQVPQRLGLRIPAGLLVKA
jgi:GNAT superfamily N-acetyltransferase